MLRPASVAREDDWSTSEKRYEKDVALAQTRGILLAAFLFGGAVSQSFAYYHPDEGRWISRDPIGDEAFLRIYTQEMARKEAAELRMHALRPTYSFAANSPVRRVDRLGLSWISDGWRLIGSRYIPSPGGSQAQFCCMAEATGGIGLGGIYLIKELATDTAKKSRNDLVRLFPGHTPGDLVNAFRHCTGACMLTASFGPTVAWEIEECHETPGAPDTDTVADRHNNAVGNRLGNTSPPPSPIQCADRCLDAMEDELAIDR